MCHAWASASLLESEPLCKVTHNGIEFSIEDIKALTTLVYDQSGIQTVFIGNRCYDAKPEQDLNKRYIDWTCRDLSPDLFHIAITNVMGIKKQGIIVDTEASLQIWNMPGVGFKVNSVKNISIQNANGHFRNILDVDKWSFGSNTSTLVMVSTSFYLVRESIWSPFSMKYQDDNNYIIKKEYTYILELDINRNIIGIIYSFAFYKLGGEWIGKSRQDHIDFLWLVISKPDERYKIGEIKYKEVKKLIEKSRQCDLPEKTKLEPTTQTSLNSSVIQTPIKSTQFQPFNNSIINWLCRMKPLLKCFSISNGNKTQ